MRIEKISIQLEPEALELIQFALGRLSIDLETTDEVIISEETDKAMRENIQGLYLQIGSVLDTFSR